MTLHITESDPARSHADDDYVIVRDGEFAVARATGSVEECTTCEGRGFVIAEEDGYEVSQSCACRAVHGRIRCYNDAAIPADYADKHLSQYREHKGGTQGKVKLALMDYLAKPDPTSEKGFLLVGSSGVGKTHLLCAVLRELTLERGISCKYVDFFHLTERIRACIKDGSEVAREDLIEPLVEVPLLAIDELGKGLRTPFETHIIDQLVTRRYNASRPLIATTNYVPERLDRPEELSVQPGRRTPKLSESLEERTDERIVSRLYEMCDVILVKGQDYRYGKNVS